MQIPAMQVQSKDADQAVCDDQDQFMGGRHLKEQTSADQGEKLSRSSGNPSSMSSTCIIKTVRLFLTAEFGASMQSFGFYDTLLRSAGMFRVCISPRQQNRNNKALNFCDPS